MSSEAAFFYDRFKLDANMEIAYKEDWQPNTDESRTVYGRPVLETRTLKVLEPTPPNPFSSQNRFTLTKEYELYEKTPRSIKYIATNTSEGVIYGDSFKIVEKFEVFTPDPRSNQIVFRVQSKFNWFYEPMYIAKVFLLKLSAEIQFDVTQDYLDWVVEKVKHLDYRFADGESGLADLSEITFGGSSISISDLIDAALQKYDSSLSHEQKKNQKQTEAEIDELSQSLQVLLFVNMVLCAQCICTFRRRCCTKGKLAKKGVA